MQSFEPVMNWRSHLVVLLGVLIIRCRAEKPCDAIMWSEPGAVLAGGIIGVFCRCNSSTVRIQDLSIVNWLNYTVKTQPVDEFTIMFKKENVDMHFQVHWYCRYQKTEVSKYRVAIVPLIHIEELKCHFQPNETGLSCDFSEEGYAKYGGEKSYFLSVNQISRVHCLKKTLSTTIQCPSLPLNRTTNQYKLRIDMEYKGHNQTKEFQLDFKQVLAPEWPTGRLHISLDHTIHLWWSGTDYSAQNLEWRVWFLPRNPKIQKHFIQRKVRFSAVPMMKIYQLTSPSYAYQAYKMIISRRYPFWDSPWSSEIETPEFVTEAKLPDRPPDILPNGFFYDPKKHNLYVYWRQLDELEINGPNFTYYAITDRGKTATILSNNSALFRNWDAAEPSKVIVWSQNSKGRSIKTSDLQVPILTNSINQQPRNLWYHQDNQTITWLPPIDQDELIGYTVSWCSASINSLQICDDHELIQFKVLDESQHQFQFKGPMVLPNVAVAANYINSTSGGMQWISPRWMGHQEYIGTSELSLYIMFAVVALLGPMYLLFRKLRRMTQIEVDIPDILFKSMEPTSDPKSDPSFETVVPGNFPPKAVIDIAKLSAGTHVEPDPQVELNPYVRMDGVVPLKNRTYTQS